MCIFKMIDKLFADTVVMRHHEKLPNLLYASLYLISIIYSKSNHGYGIIKKKFCLAFFA